MSMKLSPCEGTTDQIELETQQLDIKIDQKDNFIEEQRREIENIDTNMELLVKQQSLILNSQFLNQYKISKLKGKKGTDIVNSYVKLDDDVNN